MINFFKNILAYITSWFNPYPIEEQDETGRITSIQLNEETMVRFIYDDNYVAETTYILGKSGKMELGMQVINHKDGTIHQSVFNEGNLYSIEFINKEGISELMTRGEHVRLTKRENMKNGELVITNRIRQVELGGVKERKRGDSVVHTDNGGSMIEVLPSGEKLYKIHRNKFLSNFKK